MQTAPEYVELPANVVPRAVAVLESAAAEWEAWGDSERGAVCRDFAARFEFEFRAHPRRVADDTWLSFQARCGAWPGIATPRFHALLHACTHVEDIEESSDDE